MTALLKSACAALRSAASRGAYLAFKATFNVFWALATVIMVGAVPPLVLFLLLFIAAGMTREAIEQTFKATTE